jgi:type IV fimbrial biogenesis protein FimT
VARSEAITRNQQITVCPSTNAASCNGDSWADGWIAFNDLDQNRAPNDDEEILLTNDGIDGIDVYTAVFDDSFTYRPNGRIMANEFSENTGQFTICDARGADQARVLIVGTTGRPRVSETLADGSDPSCS